MPGSLLGTAVVRVEDPDLLEGRGTFVANLRVDGLLHLRFVRSTVAHARIVSIDTAEAAPVPATPQLYDAVPGNLVAGQRSPDAPNLLADADVVVRARIENQRIAVVPMEGNSIAVVPGDRGDGHQLTIHVSTQMPHGLGKQVARVFSVPMEAIRVIAPHVGGAFGGKAGLQAEYSVAIGVARHLDRPVTWTETRSENLVAMPHGRGQMQYAEMGFRSDGTIVGLR